MGLIVLGILRGSCFVTQAGLELVILLIAGIIGMYYPSPARICLLKSHSCFIVIWGEQLEMRSESEPCHTTVPCLFQGFSEFSF